MSEPTLQELHDLYRLPSNATTAPRLTHRERLALAHLVGAPVRVVVDEDGARLRLDAEVEVEDICFGGRRVTVRYR